MGYESNPLAKHNTETGNTRQAVFTLFFNEGYNQAMNTIPPLKTVQWLDLVKTSTGAKTDAELARHLGVKK